ncbi:MAG: LON peptidase substrate-binding domain-containing protein [Chromatiales bacterium]|nr:LON peptidase substrate-binding domain-containing protein [Chromatiales bacterium]
MTEFGTERIPLFPLHTVLFPEGLLPLRIFEARYIDMVRERLRSDGVFGICQIREGVEAGGPAEIHTVGTSARIVDWTQTPDGLLGITACGERRFRVIESQEEDNGLRMGVIQWLPGENDTPLPPEFESLGQLCERILHEIGGPLAEHPHCDRAGWVGARLTELLPLAPEVKQALLEQADPLARLFQLRDAMLEAQTR